MSLCVSRKSGQKIVIDGPCTVEVSEVLKGKVRLRIHAPDDVVITREELLTGMSPIPFQQNGRSNDDAAAA
jgi:carbon storage regulator CsrA